MKSEGTKNQSKATKGGTPGDAQVVDSQMEAGEDPAEGWEGAPTGRAPGAPRTEAGRGVVPLRPSAVRLEQEVGIVSGGGEPHTPEPRACLLPHSLGPRVRLSWCGPESRRWR